MQLLECVPNLSEGKDQNIIRQLAEAIQSVEEVKLLHIDSGEAANRTVFTFLGPPEAVLESAFRLYKASAELIDMSVQKGMHPRQAAVDVCPFIPISGLNMNDAIALSKSFAERVGTELNIPVYLYEESATQENRKNLATLRKGEYEALPEKFDTLPPDLAMLPTGKKVV
jgi:glutamate formiminotransferase/formiminotetrahydrofolate cyclodeaminase